MPSTVAVVAAAIALSACGNSSHPNEPRPPVPTTLTVTIGRDAVDVSPERLGFPGERQQNISQNANAPQVEADRKAPFTVRGSIANLTRVNTELVLEGPVNRTVPITGSGSANFTAALPTGIYRLSSPASTGRTLITVGRSRNSSATDVLTP